MTAKYGNRERAPRLFENAPGFRGFNLQRGIEEPNRFLLTADWDSIDDHTAWQQAHVEEFLGAVGPYIDGLPDIKHFAAVGG